MSDSDKQAALEQQLGEIKTDIKADTKTKKGLEKLVKFYASDPVAQEKTAGELKEQKEKLAQMKDTQAMIEADITRLSGGGGGGMPAADVGAAEEAYDERDAGEGEGEEEFVEDDPSTYRQARGQYDYEATNETELSFNEGDILTITDQDDSGWWFATLGDRSGVCSGLSSCRWCWRG
jgi:formin-binding protein 1